MNLIKTLSTVVLLALASMSYAADGLTALKSPHSVDETLQRIEQSLAKRELKVFANIDHSAGAKSIGQTLRPTRLLIFGNPKGGTPLMQCAQTSGIDLPLKMLVWEDQAKQVWVGYNDPAYIGKRHDAGDCAVIPKLEKALQGIAAEATAS